MISRAQGCLLGQLAGDALGSLVEFESPEQILRAYPDGVRDLADGGTWNTIAGQPTDDSEMALSLARTLVERGTYEPYRAWDAYVAWLNSRPFDCGRTVRRGLNGHPDPDSQANGAMMRVSPLGIFGAKHDLLNVGNWAREDAELTHPHPVCVEANALFTMAIARAVAESVSAEDLYEDISTWARDMGVSSALIKTTANAADAAPRDYATQQGWVLIAFQNALWQMLHAENLEEGVVATVMCGGDTDTNAAIVGALLGAVYGRDAIPGRWLHTLQNCRPEHGRQGVRWPRPQCFWPVDAPELAEQLLQRRSRTEEDD